MGRVLAVPEQEMLTFRVGKDSPLVNGTTLKRLN